MPGGLSSTHSATLPLNQLPKFFQAAWCLTRKSAYTTSAPPSSGGEQGREVGRVVLEVVVQ